VLDDKTLIKRLRRRIAELQAELAVTQQVAAGGGYGEDGDTSRPSSSPARSNEPPDRAK
jgi:hypothetical protein